MADNEQKPFAAFDVQCGDGTSGRISATSEAEATERAGEMCQVHNGVKSEPRPRS